MRGAQPPQVPLRGDVTGVGSWGEEPPRLYGTQLGRFKRKLWIRRRLLAWVQCTFGTGNVAAQHFKMNLAYCFGIVLIVSAVKFRICAALHTSSNPVGSQLRAERRKYPISAKMLP